MCSRNRCWPQCGSTSSRKTGPPIKPIRRSCSRSMTERSNTPGCRTQAKSHTGSDERQPRLEVLTAFMFATASSSPGCETFVGIQNVGLDEIDDLCFVTQLRHGARKRYPVEQLVLSRVLELLVCQLAPTGKAAFSKFCQA